MVGRDKPTPKASLSVPRPSALNLPALRKCRELLNRERFAASPWVDARLPQCPVRPLGVAQGAQRVAKRFAAHLKRRANHRLEGLGLLGQRCFAGKEPHDGALDLGRGVE